MKWIFVILLFWHITIQAQPPIAFAKCYGGTRGEGGSCIFSTSDGGFLIVGGTSSNDGDVSGAHLLYDSINNVWVPYRDAWVIKTDGIGNIVWQKCLGGFSVEEGITGLEVDSGYVLGVTSGSWDGDLTHNNGDTDYWIVKIDYTGNIVWQHSYGGSSTENLYGLAKCPDGGILVAGSTNSFDGDVIGHHGIAGWDAWLLKLNSMGNLQWQKCLGGTEGELYQQVQTDDFGNIYFVTMTGSTDADITCNFGRNIWLAKLDSSGNIIWDNCFGGTGGQFIYSMRIYNDKILMSGRTASSNGDLSHNYGYFDAWILLTDTSGNKILSESFGGSLPDTFNDAVLSDEGKIYAGGTTMSSDHDVTLNHPGFNAIDCWVVCIDTSGNLQWQNTYGGYESEDLKSIIYLPGNKLMFTGATDSPNNGDVTDYHGLGYGQVWTVQLDLLNNIVDNDFFQNVIIYPQPFKNDININIGNKIFELANVSLFDIQGRNISIKSEITGSVIKIFPENELIPGLYIGTIIINKKIISFKVLKVV